MNGAARLMFLLSILLSLFVFLFCFFFLLLVFLFLFFSWSRCRCCCGCRCCSCDGGCLAVSPAREDELIAALVEDAPKAVPAPAPAPGMWEVLWGLVCWFWFGFVSVLFCVSFVLSSFWLCLGFVWLGFGFGFGLSFVSSLVCWLVGFLKTIGSTKSPFVGLILSFLVTLSQSRCFFNVQYLEKLVLPFLQWMLLLFQARFSEGFTLFYLRSAHLINIHMCWAKATPGFLTMHTHIKACYNSPLNVSNILGATLKTQSKPDCKILQKATTRTQTALLTTTKWPNNSQNKLEEAPKDPYHLYRSWSNLINPTTPV